PVMRRRAMRGRWSRNAGLSWPVGRPPQVALPPELRCQSIPGFITDCSTTDAELGALPSPWHPDRPRARFDRAGRKRAGTGMQLARQIMKVRPTGVIPPMTTPFTKDGEVDLKLVAPQVDWLIDAGSHGMAAGGSTGEGHTLDHEEYRDLMAATVEASRGRIPVIAGIIVDSTRDAIRRGKLVHDMNVAALQVTPVHYLFKPDEQAMVDHFRRMADETGMPVIIYNVVPWSYLSPALLTRIMNEVP